MRLRPISKLDVAAMQNVLERSTDYYELVVGHPPGPAEANSIFAVLPEGVDNYENKLLLAISGHDESMLGIADVIRNWPSSGSWIIGLLVLVPEARNEGKGAAAVRQIEDQALQEGATSMRVAVYRANKRALSFWARNGYRPSEDATGADPAVLLKDLTA